MSEQNEQQGQEQERVEGHAGHGELVAPVPEQAEGPQLVVLVNKRRLYKLRAGVTLEAMQAKYPDKQIEVVEPPSQEELREAVFDGVCGTPCEEGCDVEPDGECCHGYPSWLRLYGVI